MSAVDRRPFLRAVFRRYKVAFFGLALISAALNVLLLGGSIYMLLIYDSVLPSHSIPTLMGLLILVVIVYLFQGFFDNARGRILSDVAVALDKEMSRSTQFAVSEASLRGARLPGDGLVAMRDLDQVRNFLSGPGPSALIDLPWIVFFLGVLFLLHVWLGVAALIGAIILIGITLLTDRMTREPTQRASQVAGLRNAAAETNIRHVELFTALGMRSRMRDRWATINDSYLAAQNNLSRTAGVLGGGSKIFRLFLQSAVLTVGALLVIDGQASGGVIFAASILAGRALAPVDQAIANWRGFAAARAGWARLNELLSKLPEAPDSSVLLPPPSRELVAEQLFVVPPGGQAATVQGVDFRLEAGDGLGVVGPSAAGKTSLGRALIGVWRPSRGAVRLDGATLDQWPADVLGRNLGYLPQTVEVLTGTIAENIARFDPEASSEAVIHAARSAGVHDMIVGMPQGYETPVGTDGGQLSAGQRQRIALARALYGEPFLVLLDEPNSNLDGDGEKALDLAVASIRRRGGIAIVIAHRPAALSQVNKILVMQDGRATMFGPRQEILEKIAPRALTRQPPGPAPEPAAANA